MTEARPGPLAISRVGPLESNFRRVDYLDAVNRALEYIAAGDVFQVNLSQRFAARGEVVPLDLYLRLKERSPAPFAAYLQWDDLAVVGASPESFYQTRGDRLITRPIKGTRPRGRTPEEDGRLAVELRESPKDRAELTMIVDLERNDLGRICEYGTVRVAGPLEVESFAQVHHLVATVEGRLRPGTGPIDVIRAVFPGGSITGAPKIRAMQIIDELEPTRRSLYTGAVGYFGRGGTSGFNIAIRTLLVEGDRVSYQVGGRDRGRLGRRGRVSRDAPQGRRASPGPGSGGVATMIWVGGRIVADEEPGDRPADRALEHGLGLFETLRTWNGRPSLLDRHLARLRRSAEALGSRWIRPSLPDADAVADCCGRAGWRGTPGFGSPRRGACRPRRARPSGCDAIRSLPMRRRPEPSSCLPPGRSSTTIPWRGTRA